MHESVRIAQLTDTHIVEPGRLLHGIDTGAYLSAAIEALNALVPEVDFTIVTGDLVDAGRAAQYAHFAQRMAPIRSRWSVIPGNHDDVRTLRKNLPSEHFGDATFGTAINYSLDLGPARVVGLDANRLGPHPGAAFDGEAATWLETMLAQDSRPTLLAVHHPPFCARLWYLDMFGFRGAGRLRALVKRHPHVGRIVSGHVHCVRYVRWSGAIACSVPSTSPQYLPRFQRLDVELQEPGFAIHDYVDGPRWVTTIYRRAAGAFEPTQEFADEA